MILKKIANVNKAIALILYTHTHTHTIKSLPSKIGDADELNRAVRQGCFVI